jgi:hypothetical protein
MLPLERPTIHYTELRDLAPDNALYHEWHIYLRELPRWLAEGKEGTFVVIKGTEILGFYKSDEAACDFALRRFPLGPVLIHQIREREPLYRTRAI